MKQVKIQLTGIAPILLHNKTTADPLSPYAKAMKPLTSKRNKTDEDYLDLARLEWEAGLYINGDGLVTIPAENLETMLWEGGKLNKNGPKFKAGVFVQSDAILEYDGTKIEINGNGKKIPNPELDKFFQAHHNRALVRIQGKFIIRTRPIFHNWRLQMTILYNENIINKRAIIQAAQRAGPEKGLGDRRPRIGRFEAKGAK